MWITGILALATGVISILAYRIESRRIPQKQARFLNREPRSLGQIYNQYFEESRVSRERFEYLWLKTADILHLDSMKLLPSDRFDLELSPVEGHLIEDELADLESFYDDECKKSRIEKPLSNPETLGDLITILGRVEER